MVHGGYVEVLPNCPDLDNVSAKRSWALDMSSCLWTAYASTCVSNSIPVRYYAYMSDICRIFRPLPCWRVDKAMRLASAIDYASTIHPPIDDSRGDQPRALLH